MRRILRVTVASLITTALAVSSAAGACTPARPGVDAPLALVLSGGGAKGAWEAGVAAALIADGAPVRVVAGSSAGALNATVLADGRLDVLERLWRTVSRDRVYHLRPSVFFAGLLPGWLTLVTLDSAGSLLDPAPLRELIAASIDFDRVRASAVRAVVVATDVARREARLFDNRTITPDVLMAATAVPGLFPPVQVGGERLVDGGLTGRAPVLEALGAGVAVDRALVVVSYATGETGRPPRSMRTTLEEAFETAMTHQIARDVELARLRYPGVDVQTIEPSAALDLRPLDFDAARTAEVFALGQKDGAACVRAWKVD